MEIHGLMLKLCLRDLEWKLLFVATDYPVGYEEGKINSHLGFPNSCVVQTELILFGKLGGMNKNLA